MENFWVEMMFASRWLQSLVQDDLSSVLVHRFAQLSSAREERATGLGLVHVIRKRLVLVLIRSIYLQRWRCGRLDDLCCFIMVHLVLCSPERHDSVSKQSRGDEEAGLRGQQSHPLSLKVSEWAQTAPPTWKCHRKEHENALCPSEEKKKIETQEVEENQTHRPGFWMSKHIRSKITKPSKNTPPSHLTLIVLLTGEIRFEQKRFSSRKNMFLRFFPASYLREPSSSTWHQSLIFAHRRSLCAQKSRRPQLSWVHSKRGSRCNVHEYARMHRNVHTRRQILEWTRQQS